MKYMLPILALSIFLTACSHRSDVEIRKSLPGTWHFVQASSSDKGDQSMFTIAPDGDFTNDVIRADGTLAFEIAGTFQVQDEYLIGTVTKHSQKGKSLPYVLRAKIYHADEREMVIGYDGMTNQLILKKDTK